MAYPDSPVVRTPPKHQVVKVAAATADLDAMLRGLANSWRMVADQNLPGLPDKDALLRRCADQLDEILDAPAQRG